MSSQPSPSASNRATPAPMVSGRYFFPARPLLWVKRTPEAAVTSVNRIPGGGAGAAALGAGAAAARPRAERARAERVRMRFKESVSYFHFLRFPAGECRPFGADPHSPPPPAPPPPIPPGERGSNTLQRSFSLFSRQVGGEAGRRGPG